MEGAGGGIGGCTFACAPCVTSVSSAVASSGGTLRGREGSRPTLVAKGDGGGGGCVAPMTVGMGLGWLADGWGAAGPSVHWRLRRRDAPPSLSFLPLSAGAPEPFPVVAPVSGPSAVAAPPAVAVAASMPSISSATSGGILPLVISMYISISCPSSTSLGARSVGGSGGFGRSDDLLVSSSLLLSSAVAAFALSGEPSRLLTAALVGEVAMSTMPPP
mmetsp:Transcript_20553/g.58739  ORF Transcript_20553/g.58739 Transcript_20553/m.58739 type:complete len:217 (+) Transcript_20553:654-1304(+)